MKTLSYRILPIVLFSLFSFITGKSQQDPDSLMKYLEIAAKNNPAVQQKFTEYQASLQKIPQVGGLPDPELTAGVFLKPMELVNGNQVADLRIMQMFPWFGVLRNAKDEMSMMANARFEQFRDAKLQLYFDVQSAWYDLFKIRKDISISEKNIDILKVIEQIALVNFKAPPGMVPGSMGESSQNSGLADLYRIQIEAGELQNDISLLKNKEQSAIASFNSLLNRPPLSKVFTNEFLEADSLRIPLVAVTDSIQSNNPLLSIIRSEQDSYMARKRMVTAMGYPMVGLGLDYSAISKNEMSVSPMNGKDMIMPMVSITLPIYRKKYVAMQKEADLLSKAAAQNYQATLNSLQNEYYKAVQSYQDSWRRVKLYENQSTLASKSLELILKSYSASSTGLTDVLRLRQQTLDYELKKVEALADFNVAVAWIRRLMANSQIQ